MQRGGHTAVMCQAPLSPRVECPACRLQLPAGDAHHPASQLQTWTPAHRTSRNGSNECQTQVCQHLAKVQLQIRIDMYTCSKGCLGICRAAQTPHKHGCLPACQVVGAQRLLMMPAATLFPRPPPTRAQLPKVAELLCIERLAAICSRKIPTEWSPVSAGGVQ